MLLSNNRRAHPLLPRSKSYYAKEALALYLQDRADYLMALAALERQEPRTSLADVRRELGLER